MKSSLFILILSFIIVHPAYAYIDPGTGSMLFSIVLCLISSCFFVLRTIILVLKKYFFAKKYLSTQVNKFVIYSEGNQYYAVFKPILDEFEKRKISLTYYTSDSDDSFFKEEHLFVKKEYIGTGNKAYFKLAFLKADVCLMTIPQLDVLQLKRSKSVKHYAHILHSISFAYTYRFFSLDYYDSVLCDAEYQVPMIREIEQKRNLPEKKLPVVGSTYMDFYEKIKPQRKESKVYNVLIAPSWGKESLLNKHAEKLIEQLIQTDFNIIIRPHPQSILSEKDVIDSLMEKYKTVSNLYWDLEKNGLKSMSQADILISDWSGIMVDYALLYQKPFLYFGTHVNYEMYDCNDLDNPEQWKYNMINKIGQKIKSQDIDLILEIIKKQKEERCYRKYIEEATDYFWAHRGDAAKNVVDFLVSIQNSLK